MKKNRLFTGAALAGGFLLSMAGQAQVLTPNAQIQGVAQLGTPAAGLAPGPLGQIKSGAFGTFNQVDNWAALGESPFGISNAFPYGLRLQKNTQFALFNLVLNPEFRLSPEDLVIGWGQNRNSRVRFRFISDQFTNTFLDALTIAPDGTVTAAGPIVSQGVLVSSDQRFKEQIAPVENSLGLVRKMQGTTYQFRQTGEFAGHHFPATRQYGFIAQDLQKVLPEAVVKQEDGYYAVNYIAVIPVLVEAVKQLDAKQAENAALQQRLTSLEAQLSELRALVQRGAARPAPDQADGLGPDLSQIRLEQNAPNPFGGSTRIAYALPAGVSGASLTISDLQGRVVKTVTDLAGGSQVLDLKAGSLAAGVYIYTLSVQGKEVMSKRMVISR